MQSMYTVNSGADAGDGGGGGGGGAGHDDANKDNDIST